MSVQYASHIGQDEWVDVCYGRKMGGTFVDIGAFDGIEISNTYFLEAERRYHGILFEPNPIYFEKMCNVRTSIALNAAAWHTSRMQVEFIDAHGLGTMKEFGRSDSEARLREGCPIIKVDTLNPTEVLERFRLPNAIDFLSLDVEGAEEIVLQSLDLARYQFGLMAIEHNHHEPERRAVRELLEPYGYVPLGFFNDDLFYRKDVNYACNPEAALAIVAKSRRHQL